MSDIIYTDQPTDKKGALLLQRYQQLVDEKKNYTDTYAEIAEYLAPRRELMHEWEDMNQGKKYGLKVFDSTPIQSLIIMANGFYGSSVSQSFKWIKFLSGMPEIDEDPEAQRWFSDLEELFYWELQQSNFYDAGSELTIDGFAFGTAAMWPRWSENQDRLVFTNLHPKEVFIDTDMDGKVNTMMRPHPVSYRNIATFFDNVPKEIQKLADDTPHKTQYVIHVVMPREKRDPHKLNAKNKPFASYWILKDNGHILKEGGFDEFPFAVWRARRDSRSPYGTSPAWEALPTVKSLNMLRKARMLATQKSVDPPLFIPSQLRKGTSTNPGARNYYNPMDYNGMDPGKLIGVFGGPVRFDTSIELEEKLQQEVKDIFMTDLFLMMNNDERDRTATEILERKGEKLTLLGPTITGFNSEFLSQTVDLVFSLLFKARKVPPPPQIIAEIGGRFDVDFIGPLAQAQRKHLKSQGPMQALNSIFPLFQVAPQAMDLFDWDEIVRDMSEEGLSPHLLKTREEVEEIRTQRAQEVERQKAMEAASTMADGYKKSNEAPVPGSPAEMLMASQSQAPQEQ